MTVVMGLISVAGCPRTEQSEPLCAYTVDQSVSISDTSVGYSAQEVLDALGGNHPIDVGYEWWVDGQASPVGLDPEGEVTLGLAPDRPIQRVWHPDEILGSCDTQDQPQGLLIPMFATLTTYDGQLVLHGTSEVLATAANEAGWVRVPPREEALVESVPPQIRDYAASASGQEPSDVEFGVDFVGGDVVADPLSVRFRLRVDGYDTYVGAVSTSPPSED